MVQATGIAVSQALPAQSRRLPTMPEFQPLGRLPMDTQPSD
jgi:hypothetical protein